MLWCCTGDGAGKRGTTLINPPIYHVCDLDNEGATQRWPLTRRRLTSRHISAHNQNSCCVHRPLSIVRPRLLRPLRRHLFLLLIAALLCNRAFCTRSWHPADIWVKYSLHHLYTSFSLFVCIIYACIKCA